ncbi:MAG: glycoside hydrolase family 18 protein [Bacteroidota bacterium]|nr:glycoside hydrolase family 18 protein [Bacteroidota bacterium]
MRSIGTVGIFVLAVAGCSSAVEEEPYSACDFERKATEHQVIGFYPGYKHDVLPISQIRWDMLTRVIYAFAIPETDGSLNVAHLTRLDSLVQTAHANGVEVYVSVGGGGGSSNFPVFAANESTRGNFVRTVRQYLTENCLDGVDIDWEEWNKDNANIPIASEKAAFMSLMKELRSELDSWGISLDVYPGDWFGRHYDEVYPLVDYVHVMGYDFSGPWSAPGPHSSYDQAIGTGSDASATGLAYWVNYRKWPSGKIILGLPFYGRDFDVNGGRGVAYRDIVARFPNAPGMDRVESIYYNGRQTIADKTQYVVDNGFPGVMIWEIAHDTHDPMTSLLQVINDTVSQ